MKLYYYVNEMMFVEDAAGEDGAMVFILSAEVDDGDDVPCEKRSVVHSER